MNTEIRVPALPESVADATVITWHKQPGEFIAQGENIVDLETDKVILEIPAPIDGILEDIQTAAGTVVQAQQVLGLLRAAAAETPVQPTASALKPLETNPEAADPIIAPAARRLVKELGIDPGQITATGRDGRILKSDVMAYLDAQEQAAAPRDDLQAFRSPAEAPKSATVSAAINSQERSEQRVPMTRLRARIAERLLQVQQTAAILTTFNEIDMQAVMDLRTRYKESFEHQHQVRLGFMAFFVKAAVEALKRFPIINASIDGQDIVYHGYYDIGIAISAPRGLVVPIIRNCDKLSLAGIEQDIAKFAKQAKDGSLNYEDLTGGTFSVTNGGIFGSMLSTPILNPPQSAILGMHAIKERAVVVAGQICIRPIMYVALSYDHRIIDGSDAVQFLMAIKHTVEDPARLLLQI